MFVQAIKQKYIFRTGLDPPAFEYSNGGYMRFSKSGEIRSGSLWRIRNDLAAYYLYDRPYCYYCDGSCICAVPCQFDEMKEENVLMLVKHDIVNGRHHFRLLGNKTLYEDLSIPYGMWDNVFVPFSFDVYESMEQ